MAQESDTVPRQLSARFKGKDDLVLNFKDGDGVQSGFRASFFRKTCLFFDQMQHILIAMILLILFIFIIVESIRASARNGEFKEFNATRELLFFFKEEPSLKAPFQRRLDEIFHEDNGTGIRMKATGMCLGLFDDHLEQKAEAVCSTTFSFTDTIEMLSEWPSAKANHCIFCSDTDCLPHLLVCNKVDIFGPHHPFHPMNASVIAVDLLTGRLYFAIGSATFLSECTALGISGGFGKLAVEPCTSKDSQLFYLDGDDGFKFKKEFKQLMWALRSKY